MAGNERFEVTDTNVTIPVDMTIADQIIHSGDTDTYMQFHAADQFRVVTGGVLKDLKLITLKPQLIKT